METVLAIIVIIGFIFLLGIWSLTALYSLACDVNAEKIIRENMDLLELIANALLENETLTKEQIDHLAEFGTMPDEDIEEPVVSTQDDKEEKHPKKETKKTKKEEETK